MSTTRVSVSRTDAQVSEQIIVEWFVGTDVRWTPTPADELRLTTGTGVIVSRCPFLEAFSDDGTDPYAIDLTSAKGRLTMPPAPGGYVISLYDRASNRRLFALPYRVAGPAFAPQQILQVTFANQFSLGTAITPRARVDVTFRPHELARHATDRNHVLCIVSPHKGDNDGGPGGKGRYEHCDTVVVVPPTMIIGAAVGKEASMHGSGLSNAPDMIASWLVPAGAPPRTAREASSSGASLSSPSYSRGSQFFDGEDGEDTTISMILPSSPGPYEVRYMVTPASGVPYTVAHSEVFTVERPKGVRGETLAAAAWQEEDFSGTIECDTTVCTVRERVRVRFNITANAGRRITPLDTIVLFPYGRTEQITHSEGMTHAIGQDLYAGYVDIPAPSLEGHYQVGYFSFQAQHVVMVGKGAVSVRVPHAKLWLDASNTMSAITRATQKPVYAGTCGDKVTVVLEVEAHIFSREDRVLVFDDLANHVATAFMLSVRDGGECDVGSPHRTLQLTAGTAEATIVTPGKYSLHYYSAQLRRTIAQLEAYIQLTTGLGNIPLPKAVIQAVGVLPVSEAVMMAVIKDGIDVRPSEEQNQDCISIYAEGARDAVAARYADDPAHYPALYTHYLRGLSYEQFSVPSLQSILESARSGFSASDDVVSVAARRIIVRYMAALPGHYMRVCTSEAVVTLRAANDMLGFVRQHLKYVALHDLAPTTNRFSTDGRIAAPICAASRVVPEKVVPSSTGAAARLAASAAPQLPKAANDSTAVGNAMMVGSFLNFLLSSTEFRGTLTGPREATTADLIRVVFHVTNGVPRGADRIVLFSRDGSRTVSDAAVAHAVGRDDMCLGEVLLNPPLAEGRYVAGYFSDRHWSVVMISEPFMVALSDDPFEASITSGQCPLRRLRGREEREALRLRHKEEAAAVAGEPIEYFAGPKRTRRRSILRDAARPSRTRILIIGVSSIHLEKELKGPANDVDLFFEAATAFYFGGLASTAADNTLMLKECKGSSAGDAPTAHGIRGGIRWLAQNAQDGDQLVLFYSGCGTVVEGDNALVPCDIDGGGQPITLRELHDTLLNVVPARTSVAVFIDACYWPSLRDVAVSSQLAGAESVAAAAIRRRRLAAGIAPEAAWRALSLASGDVGAAHPLVSDLSMGALAALGYFVPHRFNPCVATASPNGSASGSEIFRERATFVLSAGASSEDARNRIIVEACSGSASDPEGAWDAFNRHTGRTVGVFSSAVCAVMHELAASGGAGSARWWELHERIGQAMARSPFAQTPRVVVRASEALDRLVNALNM